MRTFSSILGQSSLGVIQKLRIPIYYSPVIFMSFDHNIQIILQFGQTECLQIVKISDDQEKFWRNCGSKEKLFLSLSNRAFFDSSRLQLLNFFLNSNWNSLQHFTHSSKFRRLGSTKCSSKMFHNLLQFMIVFFIFNFYNLTFPLFESPTFHRPHILKKKSKVA